MSANAFWEAPTKNVKVFMSLEQTAVAASPPTFWSSVREALRGSHQDFTAGNLNRAILLLAIPMVLEMVLESLFAVVDVFWVGRLGADAIATVGLTESLLSLVMAIGFGLSLSTTAMVARRIGEKDPAGAAIAGFQAIVIGVAIAALIGIPCLFYAPDLLRLMGASRQVVAVGSGYARIALGGSTAIMLLFLNNAIFRGAGDAAIAMRLLWVSNIINLVLDPCLIFGWGLRNAAATLVGQNLGAKQPERAETSVWRTGLYNMIFLGVIGIFFVIFAEPVIRLFTNDPLVVPLAVTCLRILSYGNIAYAYGMVMLQAFNGAGDTVTPTIVHFFGFWLLEIPLAYFLAITVHMRSSGVFWSIVVAEAAIASAGIVLFRRGCWKVRQI